MANEKRLIDANGKHTINAVDLTGFILCFDGGFISAIDRFGDCVCKFYAEDIPNVDAVEVVRCKDCKHALENPFITGCTKLVCSKWVNWRAVEPNHFCSYGERKGNG